MAINNKGREKPRDLKVSLAGLSMD